MLSFLVCNNALIRETPLSAEFLSISLLLVTLSLLVKKPVLFVSLQGLENLKLLEKLNLYPC